MFSQNIEKFKLLLSSKNRDEYDGVDVDKVDILWFLISNKVIPKILKSHNETLFSKLLQLKSNLEKNGKLNCQF